MNENNTNLASGTIFDEGGYDEMQKAENHEIGFRLFRIMYFIAMAFALALIIICSNSGSIAGTAVSIAFLAVNEAFYLIYAYMTAKRGIMNPKIAKSWSGTWILVVCPVLFILFGSRLIISFREEIELDGIAPCIVWIMLMVVYIVMCLCAKNNNKVLKKQLEDEEVE